MGYSMAQASAADTKTVEGRVKSMTTAPKGEIDGAILDDGSVLHWPPHLQDQFKAVVSEGVRVKASGRTETGPKGESHFEVQTVTNTRSNESVTNADFDSPPPRPPVGPRGRGRPHPPRGPEIQRGEIETLTATVRRLTTAPRGETDGAVLDDGTALHWPPHLRDQFVALVKVGDQVRAKGRQETAPRGEKHFEVQSVTNIRSGQTAENPDFNGPPEPGAVRGDSGPSREKTIEDLQRQIDQLQRELDRLRREK
jgi:hypothetical protein